MAIGKVTSYTECRHTVFATVNGFPPIDCSTPTGSIVPDSVTITYAIRTQLCEKEWSVSSINVDGQNVRPNGTRGGHLTVLMNMSSAPDWAVQFAREHWPHSRLMFSDSNQ